MIALTHRAAVIVAAFGLLTTSLSATEGEADSAPAVSADGKAEGTLTVNGKTTKVATGGIIFHSSNEMHNVTNIGQTPATYYVVNWTVPGAK